jgi:hypothetical protein
MGILEPAHVPGELHEDEEEGGNVRVGHPLAEPSVVFWLRAVRHKYQLVGTKLPYVDLA